MAAFSDPVTTVWYGRAPGAHANPPWGLPTPTGATFAPAFRPAIPSLSLGAVLAGRYRIDAPLGEGAFASVYAARDLSLRRQVAVKLHDTATAGQMAVDEARLQAACQHPNLMPLYDAGTDTFLGVSFLVMPLYPGADLSSTLRRYGAMPFRPALLCVDQLCSAVEFLWSRRQAVHGDIKPGNVWLTGSGAALLMDFNFQGLLAHGAMGGGSPGFTAPEAMDGYADRRSDVFSLGCVLYCCLAGAPPFADDFAARSGRYVRLRDLRSDIRPDLEEIIHTALAPRPEDRFQSARELQSAVRYRRSGVSGSWLPVLFRRGGLLAGGQGVGRALYDTGAQVARAAGWLVWRAGWALGRTWRLSARFLARFIRHAIRHPLEALIEGVVAFLVGEWALAQAHLWLHLILIWIIAHQWLLYPVPVAAIMGCVRWEMRGKPTRSRRY